MLAEEALNAGSDTRSLPVTIRGQARRPSRARRELGARRMCPARVASMSRLRRGLLLRYYLRRRLSAVQLFSCDRERQPASCAAIGEESMTYNICLHLRHRRFGGELIVADVNIRLRRTTL